MGSIHLTKGAVDETYRRLSGAKEEEREHIEIELHDSGLMLLLYEIRDIWTRASGLHKNPLEKPQPAIIARQDNGERRMGNAVAVGLYRDENGNVVVNYGRTEIPIPQWRYEENKYYKPLFADLPTKAEYDARIAKAA